MAVKIVRNIHVCTQWTQKLRLKMICTCSVKSPFLYKSLYTKDAFFSLTHKQSSAPPLSEQIIIIMSRCKLLYFGWKVNTRKEVITKGKFSEWIKFWQESFGMNHLFVCMCASWRGLIIFSEFGTTTFEFSAPDTWNKLQCTLKTDSRFRNNTWNLLRMRLYVFFIFSFFYALTLLFI